MEQQVQIGTFIRDMRIERNMTQQQLANCLGITDKAVSKWERNICCPDITLLRPLADALGVTVTELLAGRREPDAPSVEEVVVSAISYSETSRRKNRPDWRLWSFLLLTVGCIIAAVVCMICDLTMNRQYAWSPPVYPSLGLGWLVCTPLLLAQRHPVRWSLATLTVALLPYLCGLGWMLEVPLMIHLSVWIGPMALVYLWLAYIVCLRLWERKWLAAGWILLLAVPLEAGIHFVLNRYVGSDSCQEIWIALLGGAGCIAVDFAIRRRKYPQ